MHQDSVNRVGWVSRLTYFASCGIHPNPTEINLPVDISRVLRGTQATAGETPTLPETCHSAFCPAIPRWECCDDMPCVAIIAGLYMGNESPHMNAHFSSLRLAAVLLGDRKSVV